MTYDKYTKYDVGKGSMTFYMHVLTHTYIHRRLVALNLGIILLLHYIICILILFCLVCRTWPNAQDETKAVYKEFITELANISYSNLRHFLIFEGNKAGNLPTVNYHDILEKVTETSEITINKNDQELLLMEIKL
jgi:hypothetical protein